ncbi:hypothetical protein COCNU_06G014010 [Cocos nucifera]|uniref:Uncharacterized protein n=1 Tax=Cocos nucifera TaxID=13894 RepID=A0A8K0N3Z7_COCNU|nr:hypothetical protein COCNU_06G014010 [Cocos nucifera]
MSKLQRSSVSFRRQGSSGRIWDDPLRGMDLKGAATPVPEPGAEPSLSGNLFPDPRAQTPAVVPPLAQPLKRTKQPRRHRFFCACIGPSSPATTKE